MSDYRIICEIEDNKLIIIVVDVGQRRSISKQ
ncbi:type II toxin-antitoxin system RelE family toxin [Dolosicoccus paucivorans]